MSEFEDKIRDSLRRADTEIIPVAPLDPDEIASRASGRAPRVGVARAWLAVAAAIVLVAGAGFGAWSWLGRGSMVPAVPAAAPQTRLKPSVECLIKVNAGPCRASGGLNSSASRPQMSCTSSRTT